MRSKNRMPLVAPAVGLVPAFLTTGSGSALSLPFMLAILGLVLIIVSLFITSSSRIRISIGIVGAILLIGGVSFMSSPTTQQVITSNTNAPTIAISQVSSSPYTYTASTQTILVPVTYNATSKAIQSPTGGVITFSFVVARTDTNTSSAIFKLTTNWQSLTNSTTQAVSPVVAQASNQTYEVHYNGIWGGTALISVPPAGQTTISASITLNPQAIADLKQYGSTDIYINIGLTVEVLLSGYAPA